MIFIRALGLALIASALVPVAASAHGIDGSAVDKSVLEFVPLGIKHMLLGWDHLLFIGGVVLLAGQPKRAAKLVSLFVLGHSTTLIIATLAGWRVDPTAVDVVIALSVVFVGVRGIRGRPDDWRLTGAVILGFGFVHGLGLSTRLQDLGLPDQGLLARVIAFNVGIEIGQLLALAAMVGLGMLVMQIGNWERLRRIGYGLLTAAGLIAAAVLSFPGADDRESSAAQAAGVDSEVCEVEEHNSPPPIGSGHPTKQFYLPGDDVPGENIVHVIGDGFVAVRYRPDLPKAQRDQLQEWIDGRDQALIAAPQPNQNEPVTAHAALRTVTCTEFDYEAIRGFADTWLAERRGQ